MRIAFSMAPISDGSNGCATISVGSGIESEATWLSGMLRPVGLDVHGVEDGHRRAAGADAAELAPHVLDLRVHALLDFCEQALSQTSM